MNSFFQLQLSFTEKPKLGDDFIRWNRAETAWDDSFNRPGHRIYNRAHSRQKAALCRFSG